MKKILAVVVLFVAALGMLSAHEGSAGVSIAPEWFWISGLDGATAPDNYGMSRFYLNFNGANYFNGDSTFGGFGVEYGLGALFTLNMFSNGVTQDTPNAPVGFTFNVGASYRYEFTDLIGIFAGLGMRGATLTNSNVYGSSMNMFFLDIYGRIGVDFTLIDCIRLNAGMLMGGPVFANMSSSGNNQSTQISGFYFQPFIGVSYVY